MTVNLTIEAELEGRLVARAQSEGQSLEGFIRRVLEREVGASGSSGLSGPEKAKAFRAWAEGFPASAAPPLSLEAVSRENIYKRD